MTDPAGNYAVDDVTVEIDGAEIVKGDGATGRFVEIGADGTHHKHVTGTDGMDHRYVVHNPKRPIRLTTVRSASSGALVAELTKGGAMATLRVRRLDGTVVFAGKVWREESPRDAGRNEQVWSFTGVNEAADDA